MSSENAITTTNANEIQVQPQQSSSNELQPHGTMERWNYRPDVDIIDHQDSILITMDMPGVSPESVDVSVERDVLTVHGRVDQTRNNGGRQWMRQEYGVGDYFRRFLLDEVIDTDAVSATCHNGVLAVTLPKREESRPKRIAVVSGHGK